MLELELHSCGRTSYESSAHNYEGWVYYPHPETKLRNFQNPSLLEVIAYPIPGILYGDKVDVAGESGRDLCNENLSCFQNFKRALKSLN